MSAIERCRTAALGGHVERCEKCLYTVVAYNSCRNRHCPKCQGAAAQEWLAERGAELLRRPHDRHRAVPTGHNSAVPTQSATDTHQDRHLMILSLAINENCQAVSAGLPPAVPGSACILSICRQLHSQSSRATNSATHLQQHVHFRESKIPSLPVVPSHHQHHRRAQIPIAFCGTTLPRRCFPAPPDAISCLGAFRPP